MLANLSRAWACSLLFGILGLVVAGTTKNSAHWRGPGAFLWLVLVTGVLAGLGAGVGTVRPFEPWLPLLLTVSLPGPIVFVVLGMLIRLSRGFDDSALLLVGSLLVTTGAASGAAVGLWLLRRRLSGQPWKNPPRDGDPARRQGDPGDDQGGAEGADLGTA